jgi:hypothetical protein
MEIGLSRATFMIPYGSTTIQRSRRCLSGLE